MSMVFVCIVAYADFSFLVTIDPIHIFPVDEEPVVFNYVVRHSDAYDNTTGIFTAPLDGDYEFMLHALCNLDTTIDIYIVVDDVMVSPICQISQRFNFKKILTK